MELPTVTHTVCNVILGMLVTSGCAGETSRDMMVYSSEYLNTHPLDHDESKYRLWLS